MISEHLLGKHLHAFGFLINTLQIRIENVFYAGSQVTGTEVVCIKYLTDFSKGPYGKVVFLGLKSFKSFSLISSF